MQEQVSVPDPVCLVSSSSSEVRDDNCYVQLGKYLWESQSEVISDETVADTETVEEGLITFMERKDMSTTGLPTHSVLTNHTTNTDIGRFLARPVRIDVSSWNESSIALLTTFNPWYLWATNSYVQQKLNNYAFFRGDLKLKFQLSASPFYYGLILANYRPLTTFKTDTIFHDASLKWFIPQSQRPHVKIDPAIGDTYEMVLPFIWPLNMFKLDTASDFNNLGNIRLDIYSPLRSANGVTTAGVTITTYAWIENLELSGATAAYAAQSDEYGEGVISKPASWVANIAGNLESIPVIGTFATATRIGASAIGAIASLFGFTNVPVISDTEPMRSEAFPQLASSEISYPVHKLTLDPKNELSVDPRIFGLPDGHDEMSIASIARRESFLCTSTWTTADTANTLKFSSLVQPFLADSVSISGGTVWQMPPIAWLSNMFEYWRGDIVFVVRVIASKYHKGKLKISFDPAGYGTGINNILTNDNTANIVQTSILDIGENREVEFTVPYQQASQFLRVAPAMGIGWSTSTTPSIFRTDSYDNGYFTIRVQNVLTAPILTSSVDIHIFVRAGDNFEFADPTDVDTSHTMSYFVPQSEEYISKPINGKVQLGDVAHGTDKQYLVHFGEQVVSLRSVLHRMNRLECERIIPSSSANTFQQVEKIAARLPKCPGYNPNGTSVANKQGTGTYNYNFCNMTSLVYLANAFLGYRGSTNYTFNLGNNTPIKEVVTFRAQNTSAGLNTLNATITTSSQFAREGCGPSCETGASLTNQITQAGVNVAYPMFTYWKFLSTDPNKGNVPGAEDPEMLTMRFNLAFPSTTITDNVIISTYVAAGPDFSLHFFMNSPSLYVYTTYPAAA